MWPGLAVGGAVDRCIRDELTDTASGNHLVAEARVNVSFVDELVVIVIPTSLRRFLPRQQAGHPRQFQYTRGREVNVTAGLNAVFRLEAGTTTTPWADFAQTNDHVRVLERRRRRAPVARQLRLQFLRRGRQRHDGGRRRLFFGRQPISRRSVRCAGGGGFRCSFGGQRWQGDIAQPTGEVGLEHLRAGLNQRVLGAQFKQVLGDLLRAPHVHALGLSHVDQWIVATHQAGSSDPADAWVRQGDLRAPRFDCPLVRDGVEGCLGFAVGTVAAKGAAVRGAWQHDVQSVVDIVVRADLRECRHGAFHGPQQQAGLVLGRGTSVLGGAHHWWCCEWEVQIRNEDWLDDLCLGTDRLGLLGADPVDQRIDVPVARQVCWHEPQRGTVAAVVADQVLRVAQAGFADAGCGGHDGGSTGQQALHYPTGDGVWRHTGHDGDLASVFTHGSVFGLFNDRFQGAFACSERVRINNVRQFGRQVVHPPACLSRHDGAGAGEVRQAFSCRSLGVEFTSGDAGDVLTGSGPSVVDQYRAGFIEDRRNQGWPVAAELFCHGVEHSLGLGSFAVIEVFCDRLVQAELAQQCPGRVSQDAPVTDDLVFEGIESRGIHRCPTTGSPGGLLRHSQATCGRSFLDRLINQRQDASLVGRRRATRRGRQGREVPATGGGTFAGGQQDGRGRVSGPPGGQAPFGFDVLCDQRLLSASGAEELADAILDRLGEHRAEWLVVERGLVHGRGQRCHVCFGSTFDAAEAQLCGHIHQQLVETGGHAVGQRASGIGVADLVQANFRRVGQQRAQGIGGGEVQLWVIGSIACRCRWHGSSWCCCRSGRFLRLCWRVIHIASSFGVGNGSSFGSLVGDQFFGGSGGVLKVGRLGQVDRANVFVVDRGLVTLHVANDGQGVSEAWQRKGLGTQVRQGRGGTEADLDVLLDRGRAAGGSVDVRPVGLSPKQQGLGLDPAHRRGELPAQQLNQQLAGQLLGGGVTLRVVRQFGAPVSPLIGNLLHRLRRNHVQDRLQEVLRQLERASDQVRNVATDQDRRVDGLRHQLLQLGTEIRHTVVQHRGVEWHIDTRHQHERALATGLD